MSSYRSYAPWKSSLSTSYKSGSSSAYSSRDDISGSRYSALATPSTYRPSFSGGTYRIKRDPPPAPVTTYVSRYASVNAPSTSSTKLDKDILSDVSGKTSQIKRYTTTTSNLGKYGRTSREPSPVIVEHTNRIKSREPSPVARSLRGRSRDPSPAIDSKCKLSYGGVNSYRMSTPRTNTSSGYTSRYGASTGSSRTSTSSLVDKSISYLTASDFHARSLSRAKENAVRKSSEKELEDNNAEEKENDAVKQAVVEVTKEKSDSTSSEDEEEEEEGEVKGDEKEEAEGPEIFYAVAVVTRATSPTPPGATTIHRTRRIDIAKTIEKTIQRSTRKKKMLEKEIQSDRLDDSTRYSRFGMSARVSSYSPHTESRYTPSSLRYSVSPLSSTSKSTSNEPKKEETSISSSKSARAIPAKSKLSPPKVMRINSRQSSVENLSTTTAKPPTGPKAESPTKSISSSSHAVKWPNKDFRKSALNVGPTDRPRKSRTPSSGTDSDVVQPTGNETQICKQRQDRSPSAGSEASNTSASSSRRHASAATNGSGGSGSESKLRQRCHVKPNSNGTMTSLSRHNSSNNLKNTAHKSCMPVATATNASTTSSSSGTESSSENRKANRKNIKKKTTTNAHNNSRDTLKQTYAASTGDSNESSSKCLTSSVNSNGPQPPIDLQTTITKASAAAEPKIQATVHTESSSPSNKSKSPYNVEPQENKKATHRLQKLSSVSNFFVARQNDTNSEPIFIESSESSSGDLDTNQLISNKSNSLTEDFRTNTSPAYQANTTTTTTTAATTTSNYSATNITTTSSDPAETSSRDFYTKFEPTEDISDANPPCTTCTETTRSTHSITKSRSSINFPNDTTATSLQLPSEFLTTYRTTSSSNEQEDSSWWQDTSRQINTASALDYHHKDDMRFKLRHIDSGETAWWLRNDEDDTLADENLKTLNQEDEATSEATDAMSSLPTHSDTDSLRTKHVKHNSWWTSENNDDHNENDQNETNYIRSRSAESPYKTETINENATAEVYARKPQNSQGYHSKVEKQRWSETSNNLDNNSNDKNEHSSNKVIKQNGSIQLKICRVESGERPWWLDNNNEENKSNNNCNKSNTKDFNAEVTLTLPPRKELVERSSSSSGSNNKNHQSDQSKHWWLPEPTRKVFNVPRVESGERAWWQQDEEEQPKVPTDQRQLQLNNLRRCDSGGPAWWLSNDDNDDEAQQTQPTKEKIVQNGNYAATLQIRESDDDDNAEQNEDDENLGEDGDNHYESNRNGDAEIENIINYKGKQNNFGNRIDSHTELSNSFNFEYAERPPPLGQCASPVADLEANELQRERERERECERVCSKSPYDNIPMTKVQYNYQQQQQQQQPYQQQPYYDNNSRGRQQQFYANTADASNNNKQQLQQQQQQREKLFISRHQNIDELLGGSCRPFSPLFFEGNSFSTLPTAKNIFLEEITPDQVRIHDSTAQVPVIQRIERDEWNDYSATAANATAPRYEQRNIDDAAIQVYKDGDYGAYLDLESSLAEQAEDIEGLNASRKNSLVVRTQLSVRVHAIIEKLHSAEGSDLRRALFSLKQVFQEDKDLVHAFVALGGLNCLVRVGNGADQNYQNYILRALGQVMLYVDGMNGVMKHEPTMQWLYSLIASNYRSVVKTALKLLLVFVEYAESNCYILVNAIHAVDKSQGTLPWTNIMRLLKDYDNADAELVIYATSLINKTLAGLNDQDSFYDESDLLEQQGMESVIQRYMSKPGTDLDLLDQLQLYEAVLKFEDGEADGMRLPDNSMRKTQRHRQSNDTTERRKSRRHSTGASPAVSKKVIPSPKKGTPTHGVLDEDSSGSTNSAEFSGGLFQEKKARDGPGVTPGLRRRRERAERHKSFLKEQQEAATNGIFAALEKREELGQIVTAIPVTVKNGDSPPESLNLTNETITTNINNSHNNNSNNNSNIQHHNSNIISYANNTITNTTNNINATTTTTTTAITNSIANATNNNNAVSNNNNQIVNNINNASINLLSPTKQLLSSNTISIINNSFDKAHNNNINNINNTNSNSNSNKLQATPEFLTKKNLLMERNATVINGIIKNIQRGNEAESNVATYKKYESDANRLNNFYSQLSGSTPKNQNQNQSPTHTLAQTALAAVLSPTKKKTLNSFDFSTASPTKINPLVLSEDQEMLTTSPSSPTPPTTQEATPNTPLTAVTESSSYNSSSITTPSSDINTPLQTPLELSEFEFETNTPAFDSNEMETATILTDTTTTTIRETNVAPPPPPPPPPPPDLWWGFRTNLPITLTSPPPPPPPPMPVLQYTKQDSTLQVQDNLLQITESDNEDKKLLLQLKRDHTVKDLTHKLSNLPTSPTQEDKLQNRIVGDMSGLISKAKEGLAKSKSKGEMSRSSSIDQEIKKPEPKKTENELHWEELVRNMSRPLNLCDLDFTDLNSDDEKDMLAPRGLGGGVPPPPPPLGGIPPPMMMPPPMFSYSGYGNASLGNSINSSLNGSLNGDIGNTNTIKKNKKTVKLFWKEVREDMIPVVVGKTIWDELPSSNVDTQKLEHLFESRAKDLMTKKQQEMNKSKEVIVLDHKRSNAINIAMTKLPPPRAIKTAILKMDATVVTREGIDKLLNMLPTDEERGKIQEAQMASPELPLGSAEQFLLTLASISELAARLKLWAFRLDFDNSEKEIAEPLMDLKQGIEILRNNRTFKCILSTLLSVGIFLNGAPVKGFQIEYLAKVPEVKDTVHKHSLLHHLCHMVMESGTETTDLYSEIGPITRSSKADFTDLAHNLAQLETECKASWDRLKLMAKHDCPPQLKQKLVDFLADCAERIIILQAVHRRVINRYRKFLMWLGVPQHSIAESRPNEFCRIVSEFALEYRTTRERVQQQIEKKANHRERNKTRGKLIIDMAKFKTKEDRADAELKELLGTPSSDTADGTLTWRRRRAENLRSPIARQNDENFTDGDDEILESLVKTATKAPGTRTTPRERKRTRHADRKSLKRSRTREGFTVERPPSP